MQSYETTVTRQAESKPCIGFVSPQNSTSNTGDALNGKISSEELRVHEYLDASFVL